MPSRRLSARPPGNLFKPSQSQSLYSEQELGYDFVPSRFFSVSALYSIWAVACRKLFMGFSIRILWSGLQAILPSFPNPGIDLRACTRLRYGWILLPLSREAADADWHPAVILKIKELIVALFANTHGFSFRYYFTCTFPPILLRTGTKKPKM